MPFELDLIGERSRSSSYNFGQSGDWGWLSKQDFSYDRAWQSVGNKSRGKILGGPTLQQSWEKLDPQRYTILPPPPPTFNPILAGERLGPTTRVGTVSLDLIDPFGTLGQLTGPAIGQDKSIIGDEGSGFDPGRFLASKSMDLFGDGETGMPARLADYAIAVPIAIYNQLNGIKSAVDTGPQAFRFQMDPGYWGLLGQARDDEDLRALARIVAARYVDPVRNGALVEQLFNTFKSDMNQVQGLSSGNAMADYRAKVKAYTATTGKGPLFGNISNAGFGIPFIGDEIMKFTSRATLGVPDDAVLDEVWKGLSAEERRGYLGSGAFTQMAMDMGAFVVAMPAFSSALAIAKASGGIAGAAYKTYDTVLKASTAIMATGFTVATTNWALEAVWPEYSEGLGAEIDRARPISKSALAGIVNEVGFWSSGTFGAYTAAQATGRTAAKLVGAVDRGLDGLHVPTPGWGPRELSTFKFGYGGSAVRDELAAAGLSLEGLNTSVKSSFLSQVMNWVERRRREPYEAAAKGGETPWDDVNRMDFAEREAWINDQLARGMQDGPEATATLLRVLQGAREPKPINPDDTVRAMYARTQRLAQTLDDELAQDVVRMYGPDFIASERVAGAYTEEAMQAWSRRQVEQLGGNPDALGSHNLEGWAQVVRTLHQYEYHWWNGELAAAIEKEALDEAGKIAVVRSDHIFQNDVDYAIAILEGGDEAAARALVAEMIRTKQEAADWFARTWVPKTGVQRLPENVEPAVFRKWLEEISPALPSRRQNAAAGADTGLMPVNTVQRQLDAEGTWTLAFKPVDADGNFISYVRGSDGSVFKSPWVEYPLGSADNIELGNHGMLQGRLDGVFRGFRTWRISEMQRGGLFRSLTGRFDFLPQQIDQFHAAVLNISREAHIQPQTAGAAAKAESLPFGVQTAQAIEGAAERIFGKGPYLTREGVAVEIDWLDEITRAYRQAFKLNLTAGLTSHLKSRLGPVGAFVAWGSDIIYPAWRFGFSFLFKGGELLESKVFNAMLGVVKGDPTTRTLFTRGGLGNDVSLLNSEMAYDQLTRALGQGRVAQWTASQRLAASLSLHARRVPEDFSLAAETSSTQAVANEFQAAHGGVGQVPAYATPGHVPPSGPVIYDPKHPVGRDVPMDFSTDPAVFTSTYELPDLPEDRGMWHATTNMDAVLEEGLKSRQELQTRTHSWAPEQLVQLGDTVRTGDGRLHYVVGEPYQGKPRRGLKAEIKRAKAAYDADLATFRKVDEEMAETEQLIDPNTPLNAIQRLKFDNLRQRWVAAQADLDHSGAAHTNLIRELEEAQQWLVPTTLKKGDQIPGELGDDIIYPMKAKHILAIEEPGGGVVWASDQVGLGAHAPDPYVSVTVDQTHAFTIADRVRLAARAARNEVTIEEILNHYNQHAPHVYADEFDLLKEHVNQALRRDGSGVAASDEAGFIKGLEGLFPDGQGKYRLVQILDRELHSIGSTAAGEWSGAVGLVGQWEGVRLINPDTIGVVQVAARNAETLPGGMVSISGPSFVKRTGPDHFELQFSSKDLFVIDDRPMLPDLATDQDGLLRQLHATQAKEPVTRPAYSEEGGLQAELNELIGENGVMPGLEGRAAEILARLEEIERRAGDGGPILLFDNLTAGRQEDVRQMLYDSGDLFPGATPEQTQAAYARFQRRPGAADNLEDIAGTPEAFGRILRDTAREQAKSSKGRARRAWDTFWQPTGYKQDKSLDLQLQIMEREFPAMLRASGNDGLVEVFRSLGLREDRWARWLLEDRKLLDDWMNAKTPEAFDDLVAHAGGDELRGSFDELYASDEWQTISALWNLNLKSAADEAFGVHFFMPYRSAFERSINHPVLGIYPASWAIKAARQWGKFLYDNRTFGDVRLGQAPAQAIAEIARAQAVQFAMDNPESLQEFLEEGPLGSTIFIFNLLMPGDWSALPFPLSRTIRELLRGNVDPGSIIQSNIDFMGVTRDARLVGESAGEMRELLFGPEEDPQKQITMWSTRNYEANWPAAR